MSAEEHEHQAQQQLGKTPAHCGVVTISDTRTPETDAGGDLLASLLSDAGHLVETRELVRDEPVQITGAFERCLARPIELLITTGGTGIAPRDGTIELLAPKLTRELPGFGELFRALSFEEIGGAAMLSRAIGGVVAREDERDLLLFVLPGSPNAIQLAMSRLILPQLTHMRALLHRMS